MVLSPYFSDKELVASLKQQFPKEQQNKIDFYFWLNNATVTNDGFIVQVKSRKFLINKYTGFVIKEI